MTINKNEIILPINIWKHIFEGKKNLWQNLQGHFLSFKNSEYNHQIILMKVYIQNYIATKYVNNCG